MPAKEPKASSLPSSLASFIFRPAKCCATARVHRTDLGLLVADYLDNGQLVPDHVVLDIVAQRTAKDDCNAGCIFDGFPRTIQQAESLDKLLGERGTPLDFVIELTIDQGELLSRLLKRGRGDDNMATIQQRLQSYEQETSPLVKYYDERQLLKTIDAAGTAEQVYDKILTAVGVA